MYTFLVFLYTKKEYRYIYLHGSKTLQGEEEVSRRLLISGNSEVTSVAVVLFSGCSMTVTPSRHQKTGHNKV